jgi:dTDP-4-amino-4,6-dideoxygalactose transaminase
VVAWLGATPVFCDVDRETYNLTPDSLEAGIATAREHGLTPRAVIAVDLFGQPADYDALDPIVQHHGLHLLADAAQSFGAHYQDRPAGSIGHAAATSFFPAKPLGCYGDGGAVFTDDDDLAWHARSLRVHGQGNDKYDNVHIGMNGRLDAMQAAILLEKLAIFDDELARREAIGNRYNRELADCVGVPVRRDDRTSAWAQYTLRVADRATLAARLKEDGVPTAVYYPKPLSEQTAYRRYPTARGGTPTAAELAQCVLSLPMHPYMDEATQTYIIDAVRRHAG